MQPLPEPVVLFAGLIVSAAFFVGVVRTVVHAYHTNKDSLVISEGIRDAHNAIVDTASDDLIDFDLAIDDLNGLIPQFLSSLSVSLVASTWDAKTVVLNEWNRRRVPDRALLKQRLTDEVASLEEVTSARSFIEAFEQVGRIYLITMLRGEFPCPERLDTYYDREVVRLLIAYSNAIFEPGDEPLGEELGEYIGSQLESDWAKTSPLAILAIYWLRRELAAISSEEWLPAIDNRLVPLKFWATKDELLSLSTADIALGIAEGDRESIVSAIASYYGRRRFPFFLLYFNRKRFLSRARSVASVSA